MIDIYKYSIEMRPYKLGELANFYGVHRKTFRNWLKPIKEKIGVRVGHFYNVNQVDIIFDGLPLPRTRELLSDTD
jgi:hypothetical protein